MRPEGTKARRHGGTKGLALAAGASLVCTCLLGACGAKDFQNENDRLRRLTIEQGTRIEALEARAGELEAKLAEANRAREAALAPDVLEALPRCAGIGLDSLSGLQRARPGAAGEPPGPDRVVVYIEPFDGRRRFVQIVGTLTVDAIIAGPPGGGGQPVTVGVMLGPAEVREAYRTAITGYYYLVELPLGAGMAPAEGTVTIRARLADALSGLTHDAELTSPVRP